jgi:NAD(P)-dependent dehydrogenase (short-subunit alcohol dehydrogenase family)
MARIFITGSADGLGQLSAAALVAQGHRVVLHARNEKRAQQALEKVPGAETVLIADLSSIEEIKQLASKANASGAFDAVIHNAGVYKVAPPQMFSVAEAMLRMIFRKDMKHRHGWLEAMISRSK